MRNAPGTQASASQISGTQRRRRQTFGTNAEDSEGEDEVLNWDLLGRRACFPHNLRPSLSGFLYGPLSVQKRFRQQTQRRARQERIDPSQIIRPQELQAEDLEKQEAANLTAICTEIRKVLVATQKNGEKLAIEELEKIGDPSRDQVFEVMHKYNISSDGGVSLFKFCINPHSFGQTVENLFYVSFLVRDGSIGISIDETDLPTLRMSEPHEISLTPYCTGLTLFLEQIHLSQLYHPRPNGKAFRSIKPFSVSILRHGRILLRFLISRFH